MNYFPIFANLAGRPVLVVGGGSVAARKISLLLDAGAQVRVVANQLNAELSALAAENKILWLAEEFRAEHIRTVFLIIAASSDQALNRRVFQLAESCQKPVNVVDDRDYCSFIFLRLSIAIRFKLPFPVRAARPSSPVCCVKNWKPCCLILWAIWRKSPEDGAMRSKPN